MSSNTILEGPIFPIELFEIIISELKSDPVGNKSSLESCSLVCKDFVPISQPSLFHDIQLGRYGRYAKRQKRLAQVLLDKPYLGATVENVTCVLDLQDLNVADLSSPKDEGSMMLQEYFPNIKSLTVTHSGCRGREVYCEACDLVTDILTAFIPSQHLARLVIHGILRLSLSTILRFPHINSLSFTSCHCAPWDLSETDTIGREVWVHNMRVVHLEHVGNFPWRILLCLRQLEDLRWYHVNEWRFGETSTQPHFNNPRPVVNYEKLCTVDTQDTDILFLMCFEGDLKGTKAFPSLRALRIQPTSNIGEFDNANIFLEHVVGLEEICVTFGFGSWHVDADLNLAPCFQNCQKTLRNVNISAVFGPHEDFLLQCDGVVKLLCDALESIRVRNVVEAINLEFEVKGVRLFLKGSDPDPAIEGWRRLDHLLMENQSIHFSQLRKVKVSFSFDASDSRHPDSGYKAEWLRQEYWTDTLPNLSSTSRLDFDCHVVLCQESYTGIC